MSKKPNFDAINDAAKPQLLELVKRWLPDGKLQGREWEAKNPRRDDNNPGSFKINVQTGEWCDFAISNAKGRGAVSLAAYIMNIGAAQAAKHLATMLSGKGKPHPMFLPVSNAGMKALPTPVKEWAPIVPVPADAPAPMLVHRKYGKVSRSWQYHDEQGNILCEVCRFGLEDGSKQILPQTYCQSAVGKRQWRWQALSPQRPLYELHKLAERPDALVMVVEGEKSADAAAQIFPDYVATTSLSGANGADKADWSPLAGRDVKIWPDNDEIGQQYAAIVAAASLNAGAKSAAIITIPPEFPEKWDLADPSPEGWDTEKLQELLENSQTEITAANASTMLLRLAPLNFEEPTQSSILLALAGDVDLFHTPEGLACVDAKTKDGHRVTWLVENRTTKQWLTRLFFKATGDAPNSEAMTKAINTLAARALFDGEERRVYVRVGSINDKTYIDLCNDTASAIEISAEGWQVVSEPPVRFLRKHGMQPLAAPGEKGDVFVLRRFVNIKDNNNFILVVMWLLMAMRNKGPYPVLVLIGEQGTAKSTLTKSLRTLVDPNTAPHRSLSNDERNLFISANNGWVLAFDNLSFLKDELSDALCRIATGGSYATRTLYTDDDEKLFSAARPIILNGITNVVVRGDLADRALVVNLEPILEEKRQTEEDFWRDFDAAFPTIFAGLLDVYVLGLKNLPLVKLERSPRMADFARFATACETAFGPKGIFIEAYEANRLEINENVILSSPLASAIRELMQGQKVYEKTPTDAWNELSSLADDTIRRDKRLWPSTPKNMSEWFKRIAPALRKDGIDIQTDKIKGKRVVRFIRTGTPPNPAPPAPPAPPGTAQGAGAVATNSNPPKPGSKFTRS